MQKVSFAELEEIAQNHVFADSYVSSLIWLTRDAPNALEISPK